MQEALVPGETLDWPTFGRFRFEPGDLVFFYASSPILQMIGKLEIERTDLPFSEADPRNDLRKWPKTYSRIPWMRLRVLQVAPIPFKPLQRGSLYYHTEFKPSPYPKLLHPGEREYVMRAFDEAMTFSADNLRYEGGLQPAGLARVERGRLLADTAESLKGGILKHLEFSGDTIIAECLTTGEHPQPLTLRFEGVIRAHWDHEARNHLISGTRLQTEDTYLLFRLDGASLEILATKIEIDPSETSVPL